MKTNRDERPSVIGLGLLVEGGLALLALALGALVNVSPLETIRFERAALLEHVSALAYGAVAAIPLLLVLWAVEITPLKVVRELKKLVEEQIVPLFDISSVSQLAIICAMAGLGEELLFRGLLQAGLAQWIGGDAGLWIALACASVAFGLGHCITWSYAVLATAIGAYLGWLFWITGHLLVPIVAHAVYDFVALVYLVKWRHLLLGLAALIIEAA